jgi:hypothetical protein
MTIWPNSSASYRRSDRWPGLGLHAGPWQQPGEHPYLVIGQVRELVAVVGEYPADASGQGLPPGDHRV